MEVSKFNMYDLDWYFTGIEPTTNEVIQRYKCPFSIVFNIIEQICARYEENDEQIDIKYINILKNILKNGRINIKYIQEKTNIEERKILQILDGGNVLLSNKQKADFFNMLYEYKTID